jgi:coniferyl-aldehyde dehydrogenase
VAFTGSGEVCRLVMESTAKSNLKTVSLELGGKSPITLIIFDDADVDMAVNLSRLATFYNKVVLHCMRRCANPEQASN